MTHSIPSSAFQAVDLDGALEARRQVSTKIKILLTVLFIFQAIVLPVWADSDNSEVAGLLFSLLFGIAALVFAEFYILSNFKTLHSELDDEDLLDFVRIQRRTFNFPYGSGSFRCLFIHFRRFRRHEGYAASHL